MPTVNEIANIVVGYTVLPYDFAVVEVVTPGVQGAKGDQNVFVSVTAPPTPALNDIWVKI